MEILSMAEAHKSPNLLREQLVVVNIGLKVFYKSLTSQGVPAAHVNWKPPVGGDHRLAGLLDRLSGRRSTLDE
jgi:hypothetical protein